MRQCTPLFVIAALAGSASAETKSWAAIKTKLPSGTIAVASIDFKTLRTSAGFSTLISAFFDDVKVVKQTVDTIKQVCSLDAVATISDITIVVRPDVAPVKDERVLFAFGLDGIDETKLVACADKVLRKMDPKLGITGKPGKISEYKLAGDPKPHYAAWVAKDVVVVSTTSNVRTDLEAVLKGTVARDTLAASIGKVTQTATGWLALGTHEKVKSGHFTFEIAKGAITIGGKLVADTAANAKRMVDEQNQEIAERIKDDKRKPNATKFLKAMKLTAAGTEVTFKLEAKEGDLRDIVTAFDRLF